MIVTGASAGIGWATARALAQAGANVVLTARRRERLERLAAVLAGYPGERLVVAGDIRDEAFAQALVARTVDRFGRIDVLINNAGIGHRSAIATMPTEDIHTVLDTNVRGLLYATRAAVKQMKQQHSGRIVNVSSIVSHQPMPQDGVYTASKTAVNYLSRNLRMELRPFNIGVTLVYPGRTQSEFGEARLGRKGNQRIGPDPVPAHRVAHKIVAALRQERDEVYITWYDWLFVQTARLFPGLLDWVLGHFSL